MGDWPAGHRLVVYAYPPKPPVRHSKTSHPRFISVRKANVTLTTATTKSTMASKGHATDPNRPVNRAARLLAVGGGKGGVGKTTVAAAIAEVAARRGQRVLVCEMDAKGALATAFEVTQLEFEPTEVAAASTPGVCPTATLPIANTTANKTVMLSFV